MGVYRTESAQYGAEGQPLYTAEQIRTILEKLALSPRALSGSWRANAGWQPRYGHWRMPSDTSPRTVLAAVRRSRLARCALPAWRPAARLRSCLDGHAA